MIDLTKISKEKAYEAISGADRYQTFREVKAEHMEFAEAARTVIATDVGAAVQKGRGHSHYLITPDGERWRVAVGPSSDNRRETKSHAQMSRTVQVFDEPTSHAISLAEFYRMYDATLDEEFLLRLDLA